MTDLYLITPPHIPDLDAFAAALEDALAAGPVAALQIRLKAGDGPDPDTGEEAAAPDEEVRRVGERLISIAHARDVAVIVNDRPDLAKALGADGVHVGRTDATVAEARALLGADAIVGATCHNSRHLAIEAAEAGASYVAFGAFFPTATKTPKTTADVEILEWWAELFTLPCVAIGGITVENAEPLAKAGADFVAVSAGVWARPGGPAAAVRAFHALLGEPGGRSD